MVGGVAPGRQIFIHRKRANAERSTPFTFAPNQRRVLVLPHSGELPERRSTRTEHRFLTDKQNFLGDASVFLKHSLTDSGWKILTVKRVFLRYPNTFGATFF
ncbi:hypothetical protein AVEN_238259-1 [Araneus ventricosus]|uniref:Uncharacterized protein n=1 Tax=Araneus ventricosus TaxID=182803 RepID=A0A4Y2GVE0_ARAVE|nr:hypothetical protein AVEN_238259-1 [Araneus ventricosus]